MSFGTIFQLVGAIVGIVWALIARQFWLAFFFGLHLAGDGIVGFLRPLAGLVTIEKDAAQFVKLRAFLLFVGLALMLVGKVASIHFTILFPITSTGIFIFGFFLSLIGAFTYSEIYT